MAPPSPRKSLSASTIFLLVLPYLALLFPFLYTRNTPTLFGFPFFYWYQFVWVILTSLLLFIVYRRLKSR